MPYTPDLAAPAVVLRQARWKMALALLGSIGFVALGCAFVRWPDAIAERHPKEEVLIVGWAAILFFGFCAAAAVASPWRPVTLTLDASGFQVQAPFRGYRRAWSEVSDFRIARMRRSRFVVYDIAEFAGRPPNMNRQLIGADAALPKGLSVPPDRLLEIVTDAQRRWG